MQWSDSGPMAGKEIDVLLKPSEMQPTVGELVSLGEWAFSQNPYSSDPYGARTYENTTVIREIWLVGRKEGFSSSLGLSHGRNICIISATGCRKIEVPNLPTN